MKRESLRELPLGNARGWRILDGMKPFLTRWFCTTIAVAVAVELTGMRVAGWASLLTMALLLGMLNAFVRPLLLLLSLPFVIVTLGFFILVLNAFVLWFAGALVPGFHVGGFWNAFFGSIIVSFVSWVLSAFFRGSDGKYHVVTHPGQMKQVEGRVIGES
jgi:putative membrane protein